jgi:hypothetical protein
VYTSHENFTVVEPAVAKMAKSKATQSNKWVLIFQLGMTDKEKKEFYHFDVRPYLSTMVLMAPTV